ncbi:thioesterase family protein [soil metagenome]
MQSNLKFVYEMEIPVRWFDMDAFGHVNNSVYLTYFESARTAWWNSITAVDMSFLETGPVIINVNCTFFKAIMFPEIVTVKIFVGPPGRSSHEIFYEINSLKKPGIIYAKGSTKVVWVDRKLERSIPLPDYIRQHLPS